MTDVEMIDELRRRIAMSRTVEQKTIKAWKGVTPQWATYFEGYRDALSALIATIEAGYV